MLREAYGGLETQVERFVLGKTRSHVIPSLISKKVLVGMSCLYMCLDSREYFSTCMRLKWIKSGSQPFCLLFSSLCLEPASSSP